MDNNSRPSNSEANNRNDSSAQSNRNGAGEPQGNQPPAGIALAIVGGNNAANEEANLEVRPVVAAAVPALPNRGKNFILFILFKVNFILVQQLLKSLKSICSSGRISFNKYRRRNIFIKEKLNTTFRPVCMSKKISNYVGLPYIKGLSDEMSRILRKCIYLPI